MLGADLGDQGSVGALVDQCDEIGVVEEIVELGLDVAVVHIDGDGSDLEDGQ